MSITPESVEQLLNSEAFGALKLTDALEDLQQVYSSTTEWLVQMSIVAALGEMGDPKAFPMLENALTSENELIQTIAISALGELGDKRALPLLLPYASNADWQIRYRVAQALGRLGGAEAEAALEILAKDRVEQVAHEALAGKENILKL